MWQEFLFPDASFSPIPFWFWNDALTEAEITRQIDDFRAHGVMGFVLHPRKGLAADIAYLSEAYMRFVRHAVAEAAARGMQVILYDEGMYPSGSAHGMVVRENPEWAARCLTMEICDCDIPAASNVIAACHAAVETGCASEITPVLPSDGLYRRPADGRRLLIFRECFSGGTIRGLYPGEDDSEPGAPAAADLLNPDAVAAFIRLTHERYYAAIPEYFGATVTAFFTDEPDLRGRNPRKHSLPWTTGFLTGLCEEGQAHRVLPALFLDTGTETETIRRRYRQAVSARLLRTYYQPLADWCAAHGIALTGHPATGSDVGLLAPFQIPGQDVVWRQVYPGCDHRGTESVSVKAAADSARHAGKRRCSCEYLGCCGPEASPWAMTPADLKWYTDFLLSRGINLLIPHAFYYSIRDERAMERPPDVGPNNTWWPYFGKFATYMRRMSWLLTDSADQARTAVLCESDSVPWECCIPLYEHQAGFCYLEAERLKDCRVEEGFLCIQTQRYSHLVMGDVPLTEEAARLITSFEAAGGTIVREQETAARVHEFPALRLQQPCHGLRASHLIKGGKHFYLLFNLEEPCIHTRLFIQERGLAQWWDAWQGVRTPAVRDAEGAFSLQLHRYDSIILCIDPDAPEGQVSVPDTPRQSAQPVRTTQWTLTRSDGLSCTLPTDDLHRLPGWETLPGWEHYSGTVTYETDFTPGAEPFIDLGEVHEIARVWAGGGELGCRMWPPYTFLLPPDAAGKTLHLRAEITNTPANRIEGNPLPSGMLG